MLFVLLVCVKEYGAPIITCRGQGYYYDPNIPFHLPGLWLNQQEIYALAALRQMMAEQEPCGVLHDMLAPLAQSIRRRLPDTAKELHRIRVKGIQLRFSHLPAFPTIIAALLERKRLRIHYDDRSNGQHSERDISPQQVIHYRDNWFLRCFCHLREANRTLAIDRISAVHLSKQAAVDVANDEQSGYGIFGGAATQWAVLHFTPERARWIADEQWHPRQECCWCDDGSYELRIPYGNPTELVLDICRYGADVMVIAPKSLRQQVAQRLHAAAAQYSNNE